MNKPRRDITLGEMQDECKKHVALFECKDCPYESWCGASSPDGWDLSDPPRFNEAQMALLNGYYAIGVRSIIETDSVEFISLRGESGCVLGIVYRSFLPEDVQKELPLDLAELFGKDGAEC